MTHNVARGPPASCRCRLRRHTTVDGGATAAACARAPAWRRRGGRGDRPNSLFTAVVRVRRSSWCCARTHTQCRLVVRPVLLDVGRSRFFFSFPPRFFKRATSWTPSAGAAERVRRRASARPLLVVPGTGLRPSAASRVPLEIGTVRFESRSFLQCDSSQPLAEYRRACSGLFPPRFRRVW